VASTQRRLQKDGQGQFDALRVDSNASTPLKFPIAIHLPCHEKMLETRVSHQHNYAPHCHLWLVTASICG